MIGRTATLALMAVILGQTAPACAQQTGGGGGGGAAGGGGSGGTIGGGQSIGSNASIGRNTGTGGQGAMGSFSGGQGQAGQPASFAGGQGAVGGAGGGGRGAVGGAAGGAVVPSASNVFSTYYRSPWAMGLPSASSTGRAASTATFGQPLYPTTTNTSTTSSAGVGTNNATSAFGFNTFGVRRTASYMTVLAPDIAIRVAPAPLKLRTDLTQVIQGSTFLKDKGDIKVEVEGEVVVLHGEVANDRQRRLVENMVRLTPGVREVRNELQTREKTTSEE